MTVMFACFAFVPSWAPLEPVLAEQVRLCNAKPAGSFAASVTWYVPTGTVVQSCVLPEPSAFPERPLSLSVKLCEVDFVQLVGLTIVRSDVKLKSWLIPRGLVRLMFLISALAWLT